MKPLKKTDGTMTSIGFIPHLHKNGIDLPVKLRINPKSVGFAITMLHAPQKDNKKRNLYALPGGGSCIA